MCSLQENDSQFCCKESNKPQLISDNPYICAKCKICTASISVRQTFYCTLCFLSSFSHRVRSAVTAAKNLLPDGKKGEPDGLNHIAIEWRCEDLKNYALLHWLGEPKRIDPLRQNIDKVTLIHIRHPFSSHCTQESFSKWMKKSELPLDWIDRELNELFDGSEEKLVSFVDSFKTETARADALMNLKRHLLLRFLPSTANFLYVSDTSSDLAIKMITGMAKGQGYIISLVASAVDSFWSEKVSLIRPFSSVSDKEIALYAHFEGLDKPQIHDSRTSLPDIELENRKNEKGIDGLTSDFILNLDKDFPATVPTVNRIAGKLRFNISSRSCDLSERNFENQTIGPQSSDNFKRCLFCLFPMQFGAYQWKKSKSWKAEFVDYENFCYACSVLLTERIDKNVPLPAFMMEK